VVGLDGTGTWPSPGYSVDGLEGKTRSGAGCPKHPPVNDEELASFLEEVEVRRARLAQEDPPEYRNPAWPDQVFANGPGQLTLRSFLHFPYQARLVEAGWLEQLAAELRDYQELSGKNLLVQVRSRFNKASMDGEEDEPTDDRLSQNKNWFLLEINWTMPSDSPVDVVYEYELLYRSAGLDQGFQRVACEAKYSWKPDDRGDNLEQRLLESGVLREVVVRADRPDPRLAELRMNGTLELPEFVPVENLGHVLRVAIGNPGSFPADLAVWQDSHRVVEPVLVRDRLQLEAFRANLYRGFSAVKSIDFQGFQPAATSSLIEVAREESDRILARLRNEEHYYVDYFDADKWALRVFMSRSTILVSIALFGGHLHGMPGPGVFESLESRVQDELIWRPDPGSQGWDGETWTLARVGRLPREVSLWCPDACPLVEFCLDFMRLAGLELEVQRSVQWRKAAEVERIVAPSRTLESLRPLPEMALTRIQKVAAGVSRQDWSALVALGACHRVPVQDLERVVGEYAIELLEHPDSAWPACMDVYQTSDPDQWLVEVTLWGPGGETDLTLKLSVIRVTDDHFGVVINDLRVL
jgi:hypothetical protein